MAKKESGRNLKFLVPTLLAGVVSVLDVILNIPDLPRLLGLPLSVWIILSLLIIQIVVLQLRISDIQKTHPNVFPDPEGFDKLESPFPLWRGNEQSEFRVKRYYLVLRNKKVKGNRTVDTDPMHAKVYFYDMQCNELPTLCHEKPFWFDWKPRVQRKLPEDHVVILKASSEPEGVCLVMRKEGENDLYVFDDNSYYPGTASIVFDESQKIPVDKVYICVELFAGNLDLEPIWILLTNQGKDGGPLFELVSPPCKGN